MHAHHLQRRPTNHMMCAHVLRWTRARCALLRVLDPPLQGEHGAAVRALRALRLAHARGGGDDGTAPRKWARRWRQRRGRDGRQVSGRASASFPAASLGSV